VDRPLHDERRVQRPQHHSSRRTQAFGEGGFSLLEVLVATTIVMVGVSGLAQLLAIATRANTTARATTYASILAQQKMEQLRGLVWAFDPAGVPIADATTDVSVSPERAIGGVGLTPSPSAALSLNTNGYCDFLDGFGNWVGGGTSPPGGAVYVRRWSIAPLPENPANTLVLQVLVTTIRNRGAEARIVSVKTRKAS
jgi:type II secretory pathway pseudopilin PulG